MSQRRQYFRLIFPLSQRPRLRIQATDYAVLELSEGGARIALPARSTSLKGSADGLLFLADGVQLSVRVAVNREPNRDELALQFVEKLPLSVILAEQRRLRTLFPVLS